MSWTIETDAEAEARRRTGATDGRYQVVHSDTGLVECADRIGEAFELADRCAARTMPDGRPMYSDPWAFEVYDRMARRRQPQVWRRVDKEHTTYCVWHGDRYSVGAFWQAVEYRVL
jgi:hypothetical protein